MSATVLEGLWDLHVWAPLRRLHQPHRMSRTLFLLPVTDMLFLKHCAPSVVTRNLTASPTVLLVSKSSLTPEIRFLNAFVLFFLPGLVQVWGVNDVIGDVPSRKFISRAER